MVKIRLLKRLPALRQGEEIQLQLEVTGLSSSVPFIELECTVDGAGEVLVNGHMGSSTNGAAVENGRALIGFTLVPERADRLRSMYTILCNSHGRGSSEPDGFAGRAFQGFPLWPLAP